MFKTMPKLLTALSIALIAAGAQARDGASLGILQATTEQRQVLVMPLSGPAAPATALMDGARVEVAVEGAFVVYRVHHRGQTHHMLSHAGQDPPPLDFVKFSAGE